MHLDDIIEEIKILQAENSNLEMVATEISKKAVDTDSSLYLGLFGYKLVSLGLGKQFVLVEYNNIIQMFLFII